MLGELSQPIQTRPFEPSERLAASIGLVHLGRVDEAIAGFEACAAEAPEYPDTWGHLGYLLELRGDAQGALHCYRTYHELVPHDPSGLERIGDCWYSLRNPKEAHQSYLAALALHRSPPAQLLEKLARSEPLLGKISRRGIPLLVRLLSRFREPQFLKALVREIAGMPTALPAICESGFAQYLGYLNQNLLNGDWYRHPVLPCDSCGSKKLEPIFFCGPQKSVRCRDCGLECVEKKPPESQDVHLQSFDQDATIEHFEKEWSVPEIHEHRCEAVQGLFEKAGIPFPGDQATALEIGCGQGDFLLYLRELGVKVEGAETGSRLVERCKQLRGLDVYLETIRSLVRPPSTYDMVLAFHVLEHLEKPSELFAKSNRLLKPGGFLVLELPTPDLSSAPLLQKLHPHHGYANQGHLHYFTPRTVAPYFARFGFDLIAAYEYRSDAQPSGGFLGKKRKAA